MMDARVFGTKLTVGRLLTHLALLFFVILWTLPTLGLFVSSLRDKDQLIVSGWWTALATSERNERGRTGDAEDQIEVDGRYMISGSFFEEGGSKSIKTFGTSQRDLSAFNPGELVTLEDGSEFTLQTNGSYEWVSDVPFEIERGMRVFYVAGIPPRTAPLDNSAA